MKITLIGFGLFCILATIMPFIATKKWWIRVFDFPHLQLTILSLVVLVISLKVFNFNNILEFIVFLLLGITSLYQLRLILPYTPLSKKQVATTKNHKKENSIRVFSANVFQDNSDFSSFLKVFRNANPDIAVLLETDRWWKEKIQPLKADYLHTVEYPLDNYYGIILLSKLPLKNTEVKFLVNNNIPSIHASVQLPNLTWIKLYCLHPMPPSPSENESSLDRDTELLLVAKNISSQEYPVIVLGDLNDVAWSHTTRMFQRISRLLDPRIGRGFFNTFHTKYPLFRWPLDHLFVSNDFQLLELKRLKSIGSDHFPIFAELCHNSHTEQNNSPEKASKEDKIETKDTIREGLKENGKSQTL
ncbi:MAG: hypothetical protein AUK33_01510 [Flavobacteriaceae bacterium CG2_30_34_30]|nr:MAG: hypothetical protein AUK33_01510 [Flavobacteriaceae bacterium CG2_30_34_30]